MYKIEENESIFETKADFIGWFCAKDLPEVHERFISRVRRANEEYDAYFADKNHPDEDCSIIFNTGDDLYDTRSPQWAVCMLTFSHECEDGIKFVAGSLIKILEYVDYVVYGNSIALPWMEDEVKNWDKMVRVIDKYFSSPKEIIFYKNYK